MLAQENIDLRSPAGEAINRDRSAGKNYKSPLGD